LQHRDGLWIPACAGMTLLAEAQAEIIRWIPACAGMTVWICIPHPSSFIPPLFETVLKQGTLFHFPGNHRNKISSGSIRAGLMYESS
jgi:hypothetical protein